ncbi:MAG: acylphosphatase [Thermoplasmata archaeon]
MVVRAIVRFYGLVQGVNFRYYTRMKARELGLTGIVRNEPDGSVYAEFEGEKEKVMECINWCATSQPYAEVSDYDVRLEENVTPKYSSFDVVR